MYYYSEAECKAAFELVIDTRVTTTTTLSLLLRYTYNFYSFKATNTTSISASTACSKFINSLTTTTNRPVLFTHAYALNNPRVRLDEIISTRTGPAKWIPTHNILQKYLRRIFLVSFLRGMHKNSVIAVISPILRPAGISSTPRHRRGRRNRFLFLGTRSHSRR